MRAIITVNYDVELEDGFDNESPDNFEAAEKDITENWGWYVDTSDSSQLIDFEIY